MRAAQLKHSNVMPSSTTRPHSHASAGPGAVQLGARPRGRSAGEGSSSRAPADQELVPSRPSRRPGAGRLAVGAVLEARVVGRGAQLVLTRRGPLGPRRRHGPRALLLDLEGAEGSADVAHLAPVLAPAVANDPVALVGLGVRAPADDRDDVVDAVSRVGGDAARVLEDRSGVDAARDRACRGEAWPSGSGGKGGGTPAGGHGVTGPRGEGGGGPGGKGGRGGGEGEGGAPRA